MGLQPKQKRLTKNFKSITVTEVDNGANSERHRVTGGKQNGGLSRIDHAGAIG